MAVLGVGAKNVRASNKQCPGARQQNTANYISHLWDKFIHQVTPRWRYSCIERFQIQVLIKRPAILRFFILLYSETSTYCSRMQRFPASNIHFFWSRHNAHINTA
jgi:hypothetical protein